MDEMLKVHPNGQWELVEKAAPLSDKDMKAFKEKREAYLRSKHGMKPAEEADKKLPPKTTPRSGIGPDLSNRAQMEYKERVANAPKIKHEPWTNPGGSPRAARSHENPRGKLVVPEGQHAADVKPGVTEVTKPKSSPSWTRTIKRPRRAEE